MIIIKDSILDRNWTDMRTGDRLNWLLISRLIATHSFQEQKSRNKHEKQFGFRFNRTFKSIAFLFKKYWTLYQIDFMADLTIIKVDGMCSSLFPIDYHSFFWFGLHWQPVGNKKSKASKLMHIVIPKKRNYLPLFDCEREREREREKADNGTMIFYLFCILDIDKWSKII